MVWCFTLGCGRISWYFGVKRDLGSLSFLLLNPAGLKATPAGVFLFPPSCIHLLPLIFNKGKDLTSVFNNLCWAPVRFPTSPAEVSPFWDLASGADLDQMTEAVHVAAAVRGGASLVHGMQMRDHHDQISM